MDLVLGDYQLDFSALKGGGVKATYRTFGQIKGVKQEMTGIFEVTGHGKDFEDSQKYAMKRLQGLFDKFPDPLYHRVQVTMPPEGIRNPKTGEIDYYAAQVMVAQTHEASEEMLAAVNTTAPIAKAVTALGQGETAAKAEDAAFENAFKIFQGEDNGTE